ncbi:MAG TPA: PTS transporter subunit EIIC, partial [Globicatella sulfidifaciens]|nr:PTS transporter subunit EIIC [Globicatella sulfidifaciens]
LEKVVGPVATAVSENKFIIALTEGFLLSMPITLGVALIAVLSNFPIPAWITFLQQTGLQEVGNQMITLTLSLLAIYVVGAIGYRFTVNEGEHGMTGALLALASFIALQPVQSFETEAGAVSAILTEKMGSEGILVAIIIGLFIPWLYVKLSRKNLTLKLPESVPSNVSRSLAPTFVAMIIFGLVFLVKWLCLLTPYGDLFNLLTTLIAKPIAAFGATPIAMIIVFTLMNLFWFFGIHPNTILMVYLPILMMTGIANQEAFLKGEVLPYYAISIVGAALQIGGAGNTLGLCIATLFAKSEKYKAMRKLVIPANMFNINEPIIFGFPLMLNPIYFVPMVFSPMVSGIMALIYLKVMPTIALNPTISMPWVTPGFISTFFTGGMSLLILWIIALLIHFIMYLPFFLMDDRKALAEEQAASNVTA